MSRTVRINELLKREISHVLHTRYQAESVAITILEVDVSPNLRAARIFYATFGGLPEAKAAQHFFTRHHPDIRRDVGRRIVLKYLPRFEFVHDPSPARVATVHDILDRLGLDETREEP